MKFNLFLLLLMTLIAVVLAQAIDLQVKIKLKDSNSFWGLDTSGNNIILTTTGTYWRVKSIPTVPNGYNIYPVNTGKIVQDNGKYKQYTCVNEVPKQPPVNQDFII